MNMINIRGLLQEFCTEIQLVIFLHRTPDPDTRIQPEYAWLLSNLSCVWVTEGLIRKGRFLRCKLRGSVRPVVLNLFPTVSYERSTLHRCGFSSYTRAQWFCMIFYWLMKQSCQQSPPRLQRGSRPINQRLTDATECLFVCMQVFFFSESTRVSVEIMSPLTVLNKGMWHLLLRNQACFSRNVWEEVTRYTCTGCQVLMHTGVCQT